MSPEFSLHDSVRIWLHSLRVRHPEIRENEWLQVTEDAWETVEERINASHDQRQEDSGEGHR